MHLLQNLLTNINNHQNSFSILKITNRVNYVYLEKSMSRKHNHKFNDVVLFPKLQIIG